MGALETILVSEYSKVVLQLILVLFIATLAKRLLLKRLEKPSVSRYRYLRTTTKTAYYLIVTTAVYLALQAIPATATVLPWIDNGLFVVIVFLVAHFVTGLSKDFVKQYFKVKKKAEKTPGLFIKMAMALVYLVAFLVILSHFGVKIESIVVTLGVGGLAIGLALQSTLSNFFAGLHLLSDKPIRVGDFVEVEGGNTGYIEDIGWRSTRIRTLSNNIVIVPNGKLSESTISNQSLPALEVSVPISCGVAYDSDLEKVERISIQTAKQLQEKFPEIAIEHEPFFRYYKFGDSNINFRIFIRARTPESQYRLRHEYIKMLKSTFDKNNIEISWPVRKVYPQNQTKE